MRALLSFLALVAGVLLMSGEAFGQPAPELEARILYVSYPDAEGDTQMRTDLSELMLLDLASGNATRLTNDRFQDSSPSLSPDGGHVVFQSGRPRGGYRSGGAPQHLFVLSTGSGEIEPLADYVSADGSGVAGREAKMPAWAPSGRAIAFVAKPGGSSRHVMLLDLSTGDADPVAPVKPYSSSGENVMPMGISKLGWSASGRYLAYERSAFSTSKGLPLSDIVVVDTESGDQYTVGGAERFCELANWSPREDKFLASCHGLTGGGERGDGARVEVEASSRAETPIEDLPEEGWWLYGPGEDAFLGLRGGDEGRTHNFWLYHRDSQRLEQLTQDGQAKLSVTLR